MVLQQYETLTLIELGERLVCENGSPSRLVNSMVKAGWVQKARSAEDGRAVLLTLTEQAHKVLPELNQINAAYNQGVGDLLDDATMQVALDMLWKIVGETSSGKALQYRKSELDT